VLFLANETGSLFSAKKISDYLKSQQLSIPSNLITQYANYLVNAFLVHRFQRYDIKGKKVFEIGEKYYFENLGLRHAIAGYNLADLGKVAENAVCNHLLFQGYEIKIGYIGKQEIDFVAQKNNETRYIQVALSILEPETYKREFGNLQLIHDNYPKEVVTLNPFSGNTFEGIKHSSLRSFLTS
jgi:predicted AAA+ superfamily ATPase